MATRTSAADQQFPTLFTRKLLSELSNNRNEIDTAFKAHGMPF